jgi:hypothetical protein
MSTVSEWDIPDALLDSEQLTIEQCLAAGAQGVFIPNFHYHALPGISGSNYALLMESQQHLDHKGLFSMGESTALKFGSLFHAMVLEPETVDADYVVMPEFEPKEITGITIAQAKRDFMAANHYKTIVDADEFAKAERMAANVRAILGDIVDAGIKERSLFVEQRGLILKSRLDIDLENDGDDYDLKSITLGTKAFSNSVLEHHIKKLGYHISAAHRNIVRRELGKKVRHNYLCFCDTGGGHMVRIIRLAPDWIKETEAEVSELLDNRRYYLASNEADTTIVDIDGRRRDY